MPVATIACVGVFLYLVFYGENSVVQRMKYEHDIDSLRMELAAHRDTMLYYRELNRRLSSDPELMEQVVREQYNMQRQHEEVYIFEEDSKK